MKYLGLCDTYYAKWDYDRPLGFAGYGFISDKLQRKLENLVLGMHRKLGGRFHT